MLSQWPSFGMMQFMAFWLLLRLPGLSSIPAAAAGERATHFSVPSDTRPKGCPKEVSTDLSNYTVSIIIPWHMEKWEHLRDTLESLLHFTPDELVEEYIFLSDGNPNDRETELKAMSPKVKVFASQKRRGLIRTKNFGAKKATAPVLMFMEGHCIVNRLWLEPLLQRLVRDPHALVMPALDYIPQTAWGEYYQGAPTMWRYEWNMNLIHTNPGNIIKYERTKPYESPGTSGGIFVMMRNWFKELEFFDEGMMEWGGDHAELSFKTWRCGGRIEVVPCSRIGHLFRDPEHRPYPVDVNRVVKNYDRLAQIWWKDHYAYFRRMKPESEGMKHKGLEKVQDSYANLQKKINCKDHQWYMENVDFEMNWEKDRLCHPHWGPGHPDHCKNTLSHGKFTVAQGDDMPPRLYLQALKQALKDKRNRVPRRNASDEL